MIIYIIIFYSVDCHKMLQCSKHMYMHGSQSKGTSCACTEINFLDYFIMPIHLVHKYYMYTTLATVTLKMTLSLQKKVNIVKLGHCMLIYIVALPARIFQFNGKNTDTLSGSGFSSAQHCCIGQCDQLCHTSTNLNS